MIPRFTVVRTGKIRPLMEFDEAKVRYLVDEIRKNNSIDFTLPLLPNPKNGFLLLQDSAILEAAVRLGITALPAQITPPRSMLKMSGEIFAEGFTPDLLDRFDSILPREIILTSSKKELQSYPDSFGLQFEVHNGADIFLAFRRNGSGTLNPALFDLFAFLGKSCHYTRSLYTGKIRTANLKQTKHWSRISLLNLTVDDLIYCGANDLKFPGGMLHIYSGTRIIGIDFPIDILNEKAPVREKEKFLRDLISYRFSTGHPEFIGSGVFLLNSPSKK